ncbi:hypothetical protein IEQ34_020023 [Dendrobium chrysotoxum]|uniref:Protein kinase domain-containing protein n=1 Tax=Dendrobium chrysotoxum TaxID=161865 RepID=A0AAV7GA65_DENCH|nr:hypothetical protein IEQ34_020023 [Dendrobium chrysotoxum]
MQNISRGSLRSAVSNRSKVTFIFRQYSPKEYTSSRADRPSRFYRMLNHQASHRDAPALKISSAIPVNALRLPIYLKFLLGKAEVNYLGQLHHPYLVKLIGYCLEDDHRLLAYEFLQRGSLENHLFRMMSLSLLIFPQYPCLQNYNAKLSDFGMAKNGPTGDKSHISTRVRGTYGYPAPKYLATGHVTARSNVYSFGVVLLEMLSERTFHQRVLQILDQLGESHILAGKYDSRHIYEALYLLVCFAGLYLFRDGGRRLRTESPTAPAKQCPPSMKKRTIYGSSYILFIHKLKALIHAWTMVAHILN